ncbi:MAG: processed acidic surface protein [Bacillaceae bacterium]|nr:processed acidic surface protein [Bacillaceae bacterium]
MNFFKLLSVCVLMMMLLYGKNTMAIEEIHGLDSYLSTINWSQADLDEYLVFYELTIGDFTDLSSLQQFLGTPIDEENLNNLLATYNMTYDDLQTLLIEYGETIADYTFIEDLKIDVEFYSNYHNEFIVVNDFLSIFGATEEELRNLFNHFTRLNKVETNQLLSKLKTSISTHGVDSLDTLTNQDQQNLFSIWNDLLQSFEINAKYYFVDEYSVQPVDISRLIEEGVTEGFRLQIELFNDSGENLLEIHFTEEMLNSRLFSQALEEFIEVATFSNNYRTLRIDQKLPVTNTVDYTVLIMGFILTNIGVLLMGMRKQY